MLDSKGIVAAAAAAYRRRATTPPAIKDARMLIQSGKKRKTGPIVESYVLFEVFAVGEVSSASDSPDKSEQQDKNPEEAAKFFARTSGRLMGCKRKDQRKPKNNLERPKTARIKCLVCLASAPTKSNPQPTDKP
jgi:hypothetical protein